MSKQKAFWIDVAHTATYCKRTHWLTSTHFYAGSRPRSETCWVKLVLEQTPLCLFKVAASKGVSLSVIIVQESVSRNFDVKDLLLS